MNYSRINEIWAPGFQPDPYKAAKLLIGENNVRILLEAGMQIESHYWDVTRAAVETAGHWPEPCRRERIPAPGEDEALAKFISA